MATTARCKRVTFQISANSGNDVYIAGTFNNWNPQSKKLVEPNRDGQYFIELMLPPGKYEYKFVINQEWHIDPECPSWVINEHGTLNSVVKIN